MKLKTLILLGFVAIKFFFQYSLIDKVYDLHRDEYLHLDQAHHLAWGFLSVPPLTSWISCLIYALGNSIFWIKFFPALFGALTIVVVWKTIEELGGELYALILGATCVLFSVLLRINTLYQPNSFDILCWTAIPFFLIKYFNSEKPKWLFIAAFIFALGFLNKYNIVFLAMGILPALLLSIQRKKIRNKYAFLALLLSLFMILPNVIWQFQNDFPVIHHLKELANTQLVHVQRLDFLKSQILFYLGSIPVIMAAFWALNIYSPFKNYRFFFASYVFIIAVFLYLKAKDYYAIGLYPVYIAFGAVYLENILKNGWVKYVRMIILLLPVAVFIPFYKVAFPNQTPVYILQHKERYQKFGLLRWEDGKDHDLPQDFADMLGWKELALKVDSLCSTLPDLRKTLLLCDNYGQAGAINYYQQNKNLLASSFSADYINWLPFDQSIEEVVLVTAHHDDDPELEQARALFDTVYLASQRINLFAREDTISIYFLRGPKTDINKVMREEAARQKLGMHHD